MAEGRMLKKKISLNEAVADLANDTHRLLFTVGIAHLDIDGRISGDPREFKAAVAPMLDHVTREVVVAFFQEAEELGLIWRYQVNGRWVVQYPGFKKNQTLRADKEARSQYPPPPDDYSPGSDTTRSGELPEDSGSSPGGRPEYSGNDPGETIPPAKQVFEGKPTGGPGQEDADAKAQGIPDSYPEEENLQQHNITRKIKTQGVEQPPCSGTTPGVVREDSGRTPAEVKRSEVDTKASAFVIGGADDPPPPSCSSQLKPSALVDLWNGLGCRPLVSELTDDRRKKAGLRLRKRGDPDWWRRLFEKARDLNKPWLTFDFLMRNDTNALKVLEGNYDHDFRSGKREREPPPPPPNRPLPPEPDGIMVPDPQCPVCRGSGLARDGPCECLRLEKELTAERKHHGKADHQGVADKRSPDGPGSGTGRAGSHPAETGRTL